MCSGFSKGHIRMMPREIDEYNSTVAVIKPREKEQLPVLSARILARLLENEPRVKPGWSRTNKRSGAQGRDALKKPIPCGSGERIRASRVPPGDVQIDTFAIIRPSPAAGGRSEGWTAGDRLPHLRRMGNKTSRDRGLLVLGTRSQGAGNAFSWIRRAHETRPPHPVITRKQTDKNGTFRLEVASYAPSRRRRNGDSRRGRS